MTGFYKSGPEHVDLEQYSSDTSSIALMTHYFLLIFILLVKSDYQPKALVKH